jgi:hypothetical protein
MAIRKTKEIRRVAMSVADGRGPMLWTRLRKRCGSFLMPEYTEQDLNKALNDIRNGKSTRQASRD